MMEKAFGTRGQKDSAEVKEPPLQVAGLDSNPQHLILSKGTQNQE